MRLLGNGCRAPLAYGLCPSKAILSPFVAPVLTRRWDGLSLRLRPGIHAVAFWVGPARGRAGRCAANVGAGGVRTASRPQGRGLRRGMGGAERHTNVIDPFRGPPWTFQPPPGGGCVLATPQQGRTYAPAPPPFLLGGTVDQPPPLKTRTAGSGLATADSSWSLNRRQSDPPRRSSPPAPTSTSRASPGVGGSGPALSTHRLSPPQGYFKALANPGGRGGLDPSPP